MYESRLPKGVGGRVNTPEAVSIVYLVLAAFLLLPIIVYAVRMWWRWLRESLLS